MKVHHRLIADKARVSPKSAFLRARKLETQYAIRLRKIATHIGEIVKGFPEGTLEASALIGAAMRRYSAMLEPWATAVGGRMVAEVAARDKAAWKKVSAQMGRALHKEIEGAPTGVRMRELMAEQVRLITSLPIEAAERVHKMTLEGITNGERAATIAEKILQTGEVTRSRATLIAITEIGRAATTLTQARAEYVGSTHFVWRTVRDNDVRPSHKKLDGKVFRWDDPPESDPGHHALPGCIWNCRCWAEPILTDN